MSMGIVPIFKHFDPFELYRVTLLATGTLNVW